MNRQLTSVDIMGTLFLVDAFKEVLCQKGQQNNNIPFQAFRPQGDGYRFLYDTIRLNLPENKKAVIAEPDRYRWVTIPALMELDPEGIALRYEIPLEILCPQQEDIIPKKITATIKKLANTTDKKVERS